MGKLLILLLIFLVPVTGWQCSAPCPAPSTRGEMGRLDTFDLDMESYWEDFYKNFYVDILITPSSAQCIALICT